MNKKLLKMFLFSVAMLLCTFLGINRADAADVYMSDVIANYANYGKGNIEQKSVGTNLKELIKTDGGDFNVLFVTDMHLSARGEYYGRNVSAMDAVAQMVAYTNPDLIVVGGDLVFAMPYTDMTTDLETFKMCMAYMDQLGVPWIWSFGNHDWDFFERMSTTDIANLLATSDTLIKFDIDNGVYGYTNGEYKLFNSDKTLNRIIYSLDSGGNITNNGEIVDYDYIHDSQIDWYAQRIANAKSAYGENVQSFMFTHIPLVEYQDAWDAYQGGDSRAEFYFGEKGEKVYCSSVRTRLATVMADLGSTQAILCGHDHVNYYAIRYCGLTYLYNHSIDYSTYEGIEYLTEQRGATLLTFNNNGQNYTLRGLKLSNLSDNSMVITSGTTTNPGEDGQEKPDNKFTGMKQDDGVWHYYVDGAIDDTYTGMAENEYGWWYFVDGQLDWTYTGMAENEYGWWYYEGGRIDWTYTGMAENSYGWWYYKDGRIDWTYTGMAENSYGWWYYEGGRINWTYTGWANNMYGDWYFSNGVLQWN